MNTVEPIRDMDLVLDVADYLKDSGVKRSKTSDINLYLENLTRYIKLHRHLV